MNEQALQQNELFTVQIIKELCFLVCCGVWCFYKRDFFTSGVFAPSRENEKKTIHRFLWYPLCVGELCGELWMNYRRTMDELYR